MHPKQCKAFLESCLDLHQRSTLFFAAEGKEQLRPFGEAPKTEVEYEEPSSPGTDSKGQPAARAAIDGVTDATKPGDDVQAGHEKGGAELGSGNAPLGESLLVITGVGVFHCKVIYSQALHSRIQHVRWVRSLRIVLSFQEIACALRLSLSGPR